MQLPRFWLGLAVGSLVLAGILALVLVIGRLPPLGRWLDDPLFFRRCLVVHVDLSLVVWFYAFVAALFFCLPGRGKTRLHTTFFLFAVVGVVCMVLGAGQRGAEPILANYVPVIGHPLYIIGLGLFTFGLCASFFGSRLLPQPDDPHSRLALPDASQPGIRGAALSVLIAVTTILVAVSVTPEGLDAKTRYELIFWGGGHILQFASVSAMLAVWIWLVGRASGGKSPVSRPLASVFAGLLLLPTLPGPLLAAYGTTTATYRLAFTYLMQWGIFPVVLTVLGLCILRLRATYRAGKLDLRDPSFLAFVASAGLTILGFGLGALIRGPNTMVPAHYHASIGAVTAAFMGASWLLIEPLQLNMPAGRLGRLFRVQPVIFGVGQGIFALGFGIAGLTGAARKVYGAEQTVRSLGETIGLFVMGSGGLIAVVGGVLFLVSMMSAFRSRKRPPLADDEDMNSRSVSRGEHVKA